MPIEAIWIYHQHGKFAELEGERANGSIASSKIWAYNIHLALKPGNLLSSIVKPFMGSAWGGPFGGDPFGGSVWCSLRVSGSVDDWWYEDVLFRMPH